MLRTRTMLNGREAACCAALLCLSFCGAMTVAEPPNAGSEVAAEPDEFVASSLGMPFVLIAEGAFEMGAKVSVPPRWTRCIEPPHKVWVDAFYMQQMEVTVDQFLVWYNEVAALDPPAARGAREAGPGQYLTYRDGSKERLAVQPFHHGEPVAGVSWDAACAFAAWLSRRDDVTYRLPTEAEWEKAARGEDGRLYSWGNDWDPQKCATSLTRVASFRPNPYLLYDMTGNAEEWCIDFFDPDYYKTKPARNPRALKGIDPLWHSARGGGGSGHDDPACYSSVFRHSCDRAQGWLGFRLVREIPKAASAPDKPGGGEAGH